MALESGSAIGPYTVVAKLGEGGMGEVYRARDSRLKREVAIKVLPTDVAGDRERLARFQREAEVLASLNHPNIATVFGLEEAGTPEGVTHAALIMELVEGEDLSQRIARGAIPLDEALPIATQVASALEAAHDAGVIHRDLKPANVKVRHDGTVKVLDFGLAKALEQGSGVWEQGPANLANSPTITSPAMTQRGVILGTAAYMAPEQAKGKPVDRRADVWAFGCVLYEMLTGRRAFAGDDVSDTLAEVLKSGVDMTRLPADTPPGVRRVIERCLQKDVKSRLRHIGDARLDLEPGAADVAATTAAPVTKGNDWRRLREHAGWAVAGVAVLMIALPFRTAPEPGPAPVVRVQLDAPMPTGGGDFGGSLSPDGRLLAFQTSNVAAEGSPAYLRRMDGSEFTRIDGTEGARAVAWSPDSQLLAFTLPGELRVTDLKSGSSRLVAKVDPKLVVRGIAWGPTGDIVLATRAGPLLIARSGHETATSLWPLDEGDGEIEQRTPVLLPDGRRVFYESRRTGGIVTVLRPLDGGPAGQLRDFQGRVVWADDRHILFLRGSSLMAQRVRYDSLALEGEPIMLGGGAAGVPGISLGFAAVSATTLVYRADVDEGEQLTWFDRDGASARPLGSAGRYPTFALSDDGRRVVVSRVEAGTGRLWTIDAVKGTMNRVTMANATDADPRFSPDGRSIIFTSFRDPTRSPYRTTLAGEEPQRVFKFSGTMFANDDWSADGKWLLYHDAGLPTLFAKPIDRPDDPPITVVKALTGIVDQASMSPDGKFVVYSSTESGRPEIYVVPFPPTGERWQVSDAGGAQPTWRADGRELYYLALDRKLMAVALTPAEAFAAGDPVALFQTPLSEVAVGSEQYVPSPDGKRFLIAVPAAGATPNRFTILVNWQQLLPQGQP